MVMMMTQVCKKIGHCAGFVGSVYYDCPFKVRHLGLYCSTSLQMVIVGHVHNKANLPSVLDLLCYLAMDVWPGMHVTRLLTPGTCCVRMMRGCAATLAAWAQHLHAALIGMAMPGHATLPQSLKVCCVLKAWVALDMLA